MTDGLTVGNHAYIIESNQTIREVLIKRVSGNLCLVIFDTGSGIQVGRHRLFPSKEAAEGYLSDLRAKYIKSHSFKYRQWN